MDEAKKIIDRLRLRVNGIVAANQRLKEELSKSAAEKEKLLQTRKELEHRIAELENRVKVLELSKGINTVSGGACAARERVNRLLREVDKCIMLMNK